MMLISIIDSIFDVLLDPLLSESFCNEVVSIVLFELSHIPTTLYPYFVYRILYMMEKCDDAVNLASVFNLLPKMIETIETLDQITCNEILYEGHEFKKHAIEHICKIKWSPLWSLSLISNLKEIKIPAENMRALIKTVNAHMKDIPTESIPSIAHQYLSFSTACAPYLKHILSGIIDIFDAFDTQANESNLNELKESAGTFMITFGMACQRDPNLSKEFVKRMKSAKDLSTFSIALLMGISRSISHDDHGRNSLYENIMDVFNEKLSSSIHSQKNSPLFLKIKNVVTFSKNGWEYCVNGLLALGYYLIEYDTKSHDHGINALGKEILYEMFEFHELIRTSLMNRINSKIMNNDSKAIAYIDVLGLIIPKAPQEMFPHVKKIKETLDFASLIDANIVSELIGAIYPLMRMQTSLKDHIILVLRKTMLSREEKPRITAISGLVELIKNLLDSNDQSDTIPELFGIIRRGLSQQWNIREHLYINLLNIFKESFDPKHEMTACSTKTREILVEMLENHLSSHQYSSPIGFPFDLEKSTLKDGTVIRLQDSLPLLLNVIQNIVTQDASHDYYSTGSLSNYLDQKVEEISRLKDITVEGSFNLKTVNGAYNHEIVYIRVCICEILIEYIIMNKKRKLYIYLIKLFEFIVKNRQQITSSMVRKKSEEEAEAKELVKYDTDKKVTNALLRPSMWSLSFYLNIFEKIHKTTEDDPSLLSLLKDPLFKVYLFQGCLHYIKSVDNITPCGLYAISTSVKIPKFCFEISKYYVYSITNALEDQANVLLYSEGLLQSLNHWKALKMNTEGLKNLTIFLSQSVRLCKSLPRAKTISAIYHKYIKTNTTDQNVMKKLVGQFVLMTLEWMKLFHEKRKWKEVYGFLSIVSFLIEYVDLECLKEVFQWIQIILKEPIDNTNLMLKFVTLFWRIGFIEGFFKEDLIEFVESIFYFRGASDANLSATQVADEIAYKCISDSTTHPILSIIVKRLDSALTYLEIESKPIAFDSDDCQDISTKILQDLQNIVSILLLIVIIRIPYNSCRSFAVLLNKYFRSICSITSKLRLMKVQEVPLEFEKLIQASAILTDKVYLFVTYWQNKGIEDEMQESTGKKRKKSNHYSQVVPNMVYWMERLQTQFIMKIDRSIGSQLMDYFIKNASRDWKIILEVNMGDSKRHKFLDEDDASSEGDIA